VFHCLMTLWRSSNFFQWHIYGNFLKYTFTQYYHVTYFWVTKINYFLCWNVNHDFNIIILEWWIIFGHTILISLAILKGLVTWIVLVCFNKMIPIMFFKSTSFKIDLSWFGTRHILNPLETFAKKISNENFHKKFHCYQINPCVRISKSIHLT
jgi:hypothetical protein